MRAKNERDFDGQKVFKNCQMLLSAPHEGRTRAACYAHDARRREASPRLLRLVTILTILAILIIILRLASG